MGKIFICARANFPRKGAEANYLQNIAKCFLEKGIEVYFISRGENYFKDWNESKQVYEHEGIFYYNLHTYRSGMKKVLDYFRESSRVIAVLKRYRIKENDAIMFYSINYWYISIICRFARTNKVSVCSCVTEYHQAFQYKGQHFNPVFWLERIGLRYGVSHTNNVITISHYLQKYFEKQKCNTMCIPPLVDWQEAIKQQRTQLDGNNIIYSGNPSGKDDVEVMLKAILRLLDSGEEHLKLHFTGCKADKIRKLCNMKEEEWLKVQNSIVFYPWLSYEELKKVYSQMDFFLIARQDNLVTVSNFPSKVPELMSYGIIPIVSRVGDYTEYYLSDNLDSIIFDDCTVEACAEAIKRAIRLDRYQRKLFIENGLNTIQNKFDYRVWVDEITKFVMGM